MLKYFYHFFLNLDSIDKFYVSVAIVSSDVIMSIPSFLSRSIATFFDDLNDFAENFVFRVDIKSTNHPNIFVSMEYYLKLILSFKRHG